MRLLFFLLFFSTTTCASQAVVHTALQLRALSSAIIGTEYHRSFFGSQEVDVHTQEMAREILLQVGLDPETIRVMYLNDEGFELWGENNCIATANTIFIDREWFNDLPQDQQRFLLAHEAAHIKHKDNQMTVGSIAFLLAVCGYKVYKAIKGETSIAALIAYVISSVLLVPAWSRMQEQRADLDGARAIRSVTGGITLAQHWLKCGREGDDIFATHPSNERRIEALQRLELTLE